MNRFVDNSGNIPQFLLEKYAPKGLLEAAREIFPETRNLTKDELKAYNAVWDEMSKDIGLNFFDLL